MIFLSDLYDFFFKYNLYYLLQHEEAASLKEKQGDYLAAINLYLKSGLVARANQVLLRVRMTASYSYIECFDVKRH